MLQSMVVSAPGGEDTESSKVKGILAAGLCTVSGNIETCSYRYLQGTSFSAPHVAGIAAMIYGLKPDANLDYVKEKLSQSVWGNNIVNAQEAVRQTVVAEQSNNAEAGGGGGANSASAAIGVGAAALAAALALILYL
jgi:serine protease